MSETAANTTNLQSSPYTTNVNVGETPVAVKPQAPVNVDVTATKPETAAETTVQNETTENKHLDLDITKAPVNYLKNFMSGVNKNTAFNKNQNDDEYAFGGSIEKPEAIKLAFMGQIQRNTADLNAFRAQTTDIANIKEQYPDWKFMTSPLGVIACNQTTGKTCKLEELEQLVS